MKTNPIIEVPATRLERGIHIITYTFLGLLYLFVTLQYSSLPDQIPAHYNFNGEITRTMSKGGIWIFPIITTIFSFVFSFMCKIPYMSNYPVKVTEENAEPVYKEGRLMLATLGLFLVLFMSSTVWQTINDAQHEQIVSETPWLIKGLMIGILIHIIYFFIRIRKHKLD
ncbi:MULTISPECIES: DUF1648 domain-containing protein [Oceanobacillus]|uniref:DUF1648 domain-containing protein n=2 Tax=Bacillaceae TaxID=186817 RepID=A0ABQ5TN59_9BACI|nr:MULTISPECIES: DUF1648 domain-containing protein [Oceanobacillus]MBT2600158.1 DUF1648 domain-containing protein [Oceanobacillus sp. ISL-74]MBT2650316.1 DUF1648 domain-containing protein [Oceanobacillus sp. ISL-73]MCT1578059.1 DUF1648 domain-containing protein [Oceanobacillus kimchii]MCT2137619.1 DUF1648 domain-containing protein [Oceanobacillus kimchii]GLO67199.1 hypothetical protein MACH08_29830 [Oceanobacillus kimchii]